MLILMRSRAIGWNNMLASEIMLAYFIYNFGNFVYLLGLELDPKAGCEE
jgi:hypothetical protein